MASEKPPEIVPVTTAEIEVLDAGSGDGTNSRALFPNARIYRVDIDPAWKPDLVHDIQEPLPSELHLGFDIVLCCHVLQHIHRLKVVDAVKNIRSALRYGGLAYLIVPSLEWCAREILKDRPSDALLPVLYGDPDKPYQGHQSGYTLMMLRQVAFMAGLHTRQAYLADFTVNMTGPKGTVQYVAKQNIVVAMRAQDDSDPG